MSLQIDTALSLNPLNKNNHSRQFLVRLNPIYDDYITVWAWKTGLAKAQIIRSLVHYAPWNEDFNRLMERYDKPDHKWMTVRIWDENAEYWKWAK